MRKIEGLIPTSYEAAERALNGKQTKRLNANTSLVNLGWFENCARVVIGLRLHDTIIVEYYSGGSMVLNTGGWRTVTTKARINAALRESPYYLYQKAHEWIVRARGSVWSTKFTEGLGLSTIKN